MTYYSIPGVKTLDNTRKVRPSVADLADANTNFTEARARWASQPTKTIGMEIGELCHRNGTPAKILHEEYDQHKNQVVQVMQESSQVGSGTIETTWAPDGPKRMKVVQQRSIHS